MEAVASNQRLGLQLVLFLFIASFPSILAEGPTDATIVVRGAAKVAETDENFVCATIDWWPPEKCNYKQCPWGESTVLYLDLSHPFLAKAVQAFGNLRIRIGGSLQDQVVYNVGNMNYPCHPFRKMADGLFGFSKGCLRMDRWDELNQFFHKTGAIVTFGLNALYGRHKIRRGVWGGAWVSSNAYDFIKYTIDKGYKINSWEFGNELSGRGIGASVSAELYGKDLIKLDAHINELYKNSRSRPLLLAPGGFFNEDWYTKLLEVSGSNIVNAMTHHMYNLGAGDDPRLIYKILDPHHLSLASETFSNLQRTIEKHGPWASAWVGESGGAYNSGGHLISDTFIDSFWYLDQLGMASKYNTKVYCRQTLIGGNYGLLNTTTVTPNPDYYSALLWHRLMGKRVLSVQSDASPFLRAYAHCSKGKAGVTLLLINLSNQTDFRISVQNDVKINMNIGESTRREGSFIYGLKKTVSWVGRVASVETTFREEYHLSPNGNLRSQMMLLNGTPLELTEDGNIPTLEPALVRMNSPVFVAPLSIAFVAFPNLDAPACAQI
ncbi:hypothetical protein Sjap_015551 [Stephania japonica]|uniref:Heparanase-like protein 1 n=1 Tax=Stephania japonica TaxID=461633 RepID=A0AAP0NSL9_9MAGN